MVPGLVIVDANVTRYLKSADSFEAMQRNLRIADLAIRPSAVNVREVLKHPVEHLRLPLLLSLREAVRGELLLPWPVNMLKAATEAALEGKRSFRVRASILDRLLDQPDALREEIEREHSETARYFEQMEAAFADGTSRYRSLVQSHLRGIGKLRSWDTARDFIESDEWGNLENQEQFAGLLWAKLEVSAPMPPIDDLLRLEMWRLTLDAFATAVYDRTVRVDQVRRPPGMADLLQLFYVAFHTRRRIFVTDDDALFNAASAVLVGRYNNVRVMRPGALIG